MKKQWAAPILVGWGCRHVVPGAAHLTARPNILMITADDMHWDSVGAYGCPVAATTPHIDRLAAEGFRFQYAYVPISLCTPSRQVMLSGKRRRPKAYVTPDDAAGCWKKPGPKAGPFQAHLGDGSVVTYYWYRFADQPALLNADLTDAEREALQTRVEKLHRLWKKDREYLPPPAFGKLAELDPALVVTPPPGLEVGYVPIVTRQAAKN